MSDIETEASVEGVVITDIGYCAVDATALLSIMSHPAVIVCQVVPSAAVPKPALFALLKLSEKSFLTDEIDDENKPIMPSLQSEPSCLHFF